MPVVCSEWFFLSGLLWVVLLVLLLLLSQLAMGQHRVPASLLMHSRDQGDEQPVTHTDESLGISWRQMGRSPVLELSELEQR